MQGRCLAAAAGADANPRHHAAVLMFEDMAVIDEIAGDREGNIHSDRMRRAGAFAPIIDTGTDAVGMSERNAVQQHTLAGYLVWQAGLVEFSG